MKKSIRELSVPDIVECPVWRFTNSFENDLEVESLPNGPYPNLGGLVIGSNVIFSDGSTHWALLQNVSLAGQKVNDHFLTININRNGEWYTLARYHDFNVERCGPSALASFMGKDINDVFPIQYDMRDALCSDSLRLVGFVRDVPPKHRLTTKELISLALLRAQGGSASP